MAIHNDNTHQQLRLATQIARLYHEQNRTQPEIAQLLSITQTRVSRMLKFAAENGIVNGVNETTFAPNDPITREQIAVILYRYAHEENTEDGKLTSFPDAKDISGYALEAMNWAVARGLINGSDGKLLPQDTATRAQIAVILARYLNA